jgi:hypothetical protein
MAGQGDSAAEKLRAYLGALNPGSQALLIAELERGLLVGSSPAGAELVLAELRRSLRQGRSTAARFDDPARLFFQVIEPFLVDDGPNHKHRGRIARSALEPLWLWLSRTLMGEEAKRYCADVEQALTAGDTDRAEHCARTFQDHVAARIAHMLKTADEKARDRLSMQIGSVRALQDVEALRDILSARDGLTLLGSQLPGHIPLLSGPVLESVKAQVDSARAENPGLMLYALVLVVSKLAAPWQLIRLATKAAGSDDARRVAETSYADAVHIVLEEVDRRVRELAADLKSGRGIAVSALLKEVHDALRGLRSEINFSPDSAWGKQLSAVRAEVSKILTGEIEMMPGRVRRLIRPRASREVVPGSKLDPDEVTETEALVGFVATTRHYASELAVNEVTQRVFKELQQFLDTGTRVLLDGLRGSREAERPFRESQVDAPRCSGRNTPHCSPRRPRSRRTITSAS